MKASYNFSCKVGVNDNDEKVLTDACLVLAQGEHKMETKELYKFIGELFIKTYNRMEKQNENN